MPGVVAAVLLLSLGAIQAAPRKKAWRPPRPPPPPPELKEGTLSRQVAADAGSSNAPLLFCIGLCIEPLGSQVSAFAPADPEAAPPVIEEKAVPRKAQKNRDFHDPATFIRHTEDIRLLAEVVGRHQGRMTVQAQTPYTRLCAEQNVPILSDLVKAGHEIGLRFDARSHLGRQCGQMEPDVWIAVMKEELVWLRKACPGSDIRSWSGDGKCRQALEAAAEAGVSIMSDRTIFNRQPLSESLPAVNPWRPSVGPAPKRMGDFDRHDPRGRIVYLPAGVLAEVDNKERKERDDAEWFDSMTEGLDLSLRAATNDRVNVMHITVHSSEFRGLAGGKPFNLLDQWLTQMIDPLVASGKLKWATFSQMADAYEQWEARHPGVNPRSGEAPRRGSGAW